MNLFIIIFLSIFCTIISYNETVNFFSERVYLTSVFIQIFAITQIFNDKYKNYSLYKIFYLFTFLFLGIAPIIQFYKKSTFFGAPRISEEWYFYTNIIIILICISYTLLYNLWLRYIKIKGFKFTKFNAPNELSRRKSLMLIVLSLLSFSAVFYSNNFSIVSMLVRGGSFKNAVDFQSTTVYLIIEQFLRPISFLCLLFYFTIEKKNVLVMLSLLIIALVTCSPFGVPRFYAAAIYLPLLLLVFNFFRKKNVFSNTIIFGILFIFPTLDYFRDFSNFSAVKFGFDFKMFDTGHFDSYQNFSLIVSHDEVTWGNQLLGVLFFWVPRAYWENKPVGSGTLIANRLHFEFDNVSANFFAEGYINFGFLGIILFLLVISYVTAYGDKLYWNTIYKSKQSFIKIAYFISLGMLFFMLRGDLLSSFAFTIGFLLCFYMIFKLLKI